MEVSVWLVLIAIVCAVGAASLTAWPGLPAAVAYVGIPEYKDVGDQCTEQFSAVIAGDSSIESALENCQNIAARVGR
jgi:hypothetical protein